MAAFLSWVVSNVILAGLIAAVAFLAGRWLRNPHLSHGLWLLVLIKLLTPPLYIVEMTWIEEAETISEEPVASATPKTLPIIEPIVEAAEIEADVLPPTLSEGPLADRVEAEPSVVATPLTPEPPERKSSRRLGFLQGVILLWISGTLLCGGWVVIRCWRFQRLLALARSADDAVREEVLRLSKRMGLKHCPSVDWIEAQIPPLVWGMLGRPRIVVPRKLFSGLSAEQRQAVLAHELAHIARKDHLIRWIEVCALVLFWWYPIAWWASRELRRAEEECCDALVIWAMPESRQAYAQALFRTIDFLVETQQVIPKVAGGTLGGPALKRRIEMIMQKKVHHKISWKAWMVLLLVAAIALPIMAQNSATKKPRPSEDPKADVSKPSNLPSEETKPLSNKSQEPAADPNAEQLPQNLPTIEEGAGTKVHAILKPSSDLEISSLHAGTTLMVHIAAGDIVKKGQVLVELRNTEMEIRHQEALSEIKVQEEKTKAVQLAIRSAQAALELAKANYDRTESLNAKSPGTVAATEVARMRAAFQQAEFELQKAELEERASTRTLMALQKRAELGARLIEELVIKAPVDGVVLEVYAGAGKVVKPNGPIAHIVSLSPLIAEAHVQDPEGLLGQNVVVEVKPSKDKSHKFPAKVTYVSPFVERITQTVEIRCLFKNAGPDGRPLVRPGQSAALILPAKP